MSPLTSFAALAMRSEMRFLLVLALTLTVLPAWAQQAPLQLTLQDVIARAQSNSPAAEIARLEFEAARWDFRSYKAQYLPSISLDGNAPGLERAINSIDQDDGTVAYVSRNQLSSDLNLGITQPLPFTGGELFISSQLGRIDLFGNTRTNYWQSSPLVVGFVQPLFQFNDMKWERRIEPLQYKVAQREFVENLAVTAVDAANLFFNVYIAQMNVDRAEFNVAVNDTIYNLSTGRFELGKIAENDLLQSELVLLNARTDLSNARIAYDRAVQDLKIALNLPYDQDLVIVPPLAAVQVEIDPAEAVQRARENRAVYLQMDVRRLDAERQIAQARSERGFSANLRASYGLNQSGVGLRDAYINPLNQQRFSVGFNVPLYSWGRGKAELESALAQQEQTQKSIALEREELEQDVYFEALQFRQLQQQVALAAKADTIAARRFEVARNRYTIGTIDITDLFDAQQAKDSASQAYIQTLREFWVSYFRLRRLTLYDFLLDQPLTGGMVQ